MAYKIPRSEEEWETYFNECRNPEVTCTVTGRLLEYKVKRPSIVPVGSTRGTIRDFSPASRLRMLKRFHQVNWQDHYRPIFMTFTYPDDLAYTTKDDRNLHRKVMARHLEKLTGDIIPAAWRVEWEIRKSGFWSGVPIAHHHWLVFRHRFIHRDDVNALWCRTIGWDGYCRTETKGLDKSEAARLYLAKYISKDACPLSLVIAAYQSSVGRQYGWLRSKEIPTYPPQCHSLLSQAQRDDMMRLADEQLPWHREDREESFTLMGQSAEDGGKILHGECLDI